MRTWARRLGLLVAVTVGGEASSLAYFLDSNRNFDVRLRAYSQLEIMTNDAPTTNDPTRAGWPGGSAAYHVGDLASQRNFYNPEFDAKLTDYLRGMNEVPGLSLVTPDELKFHFAWWGFYDGLYDYMDPVWNRNRENLKARFSESDDIGRETFGFNDENKNARHIYGRRNRINELYLDYTLGRFFFRVGRHRAPRRPEPLRPHAGGPRLLPGHRRGAHPAVDVPEHDQAGRQLGLAVELLPRQLSRARPDRHHGADRPDSRRREPVEPEPDRPPGPDSRRAARGDSPGDGLQAAGEHLEQQPLGRAAHRGAVPRLHGAGLVLPHLQSGAEPAHPGAAGGGGSRGRGAEHAGRRPGLSRPRLPRSEHRQAAEEAH